MKITPAISSMYIYMLSNMFYLNCGGLAQKTIWYAVNTIYNQQ